MAKVSRRWSYVVALVLLIIATSKNPEGSAAANALTITSNHALDPPSAPVAHFGWSLEANNGKVLVGGFDDYSYIYDIASGNEILRLRGNDTDHNDLFGRSVALSDQYAVVGANQAQAAYVFNAETGQQIRKFVDPNGPPSYGFGFGWSVATSGDIAVIGDISDDSKGSDVGAAYVYRITTGELLRTLFPANTSRILQHYGAGLDIEGDTLVVGAPGATGFDHRSGAAYVYSASTGALLRTLIPNETGSGFGNEVAINGNLVMVGKSDLSGHGAAYLFDLNTGDLLRKLTSPNPNNDALFGDSIAFVGQRALIGSWGEYQKGQYWVGSAYLFDVLSGELLASWLPSEIGPSNGTDDFGYSVALDGNYMLATVNAGGGKVYVTKIPEPSSAALLAFAAISAGAASRYGDGRHRLEQQ